MQTKTHIVEMLQDEIDTIVDSYQELTEQTGLFDRHFKEMFDDFKVKLQEQIEQSIEDEEQEFVEEEYESVDTGVSGFGNVVMEGE